MELLKDKLKRVLGEIETGNFPEESDVQVLFRAYGKTLNNSKCPCASGEIFDKCCKLDWLVVSRGYEGMKREQREEKKEEVKAEKRGEKWLLRVGMHEERGIIVDPIERGIPAVQIANILLGAYHAVMVRCVEMIANGVCDNLAHAMGMQRQGPNNVPPKLKI